MPKPESRYSTGYPGRVQSDGLGDQTFLPTPE